MTQFWNGQRDGLESDKSGLTLCAWVISEGRVSRLRLCNRCDLVKDLREDLVVRSSGGHGMRVYSVILRYLVRNNMKEIRATYAGNCIRVSEL